MNLKIIKRAIISVSDKSNLKLILPILKKFKIEIISSGGSFKKIKSMKYNCIDVSNYTEFSEMLDGRVKTLHPKIHGGLLSLRNNEAHQETVKKHDIGNIDLVIVNLYPFAEVLAKGGTEAELIENIDIGGPSMLRSAAKNFQSVTVITDPSDYQLVIDEISEYGNTSIETRKTLMGKVYATTAAYDSLIASQFANFYAIGGSEVHPLRYGENPHQSAAFFTLNTTGASLPNAKKIQGKELSYNNLLDADAALRGVLEFPEDAACVIVKHLSPCGTAIADDLFTAYTKALASDPTSAFGGVVAVSKEITGELAEKMNEHFLEIVIAPKVSEEAKKIFAKKPNLRVLEIEDFTFPTTQQDTRTVLGGFLVQDIDTKNLEEKDITIVTKRQPSEEELNNLWFAWKAVKTVKSNAIVIAKDGATVGIGGGLTSRIDSSELAVRKAGDRAVNASCASDAFFPFADGPEALAAAGITSIIQPGGSRNDQEVIDKCDELGIAMVFTGTRAFKH